MSRLRRGLTYGGGAVGLLAVLVLAGFVLGFLGVPAVDGVENRFAAVDDSTTVIETNLTLSNPNPVGASLGGLAIDYDIAMNEVPMAAGTKSGLSVGSGNSTVPFTTGMNNTRIPAWWFTHVDNGERTDVVIDVDVSHGLLGGRSVSLPQEQTVETDIIGQFNDSRTRPIDANRPIVSDPVLYVNETTASYGENVTRERTPLDMAFTVYNPKHYPYTVSEIGYTVEMNGIKVGEGGTADPSVVPGRSAETLRATTVIRNENLDDWWVSHLERDQVTDLTIDFYLVVDPEATDVLGETVEPIELDVDQLDYQTTIETDIFGTKASDGLTGPDEASTDGTGAGDGADSGSESTEATTATPTETRTPTPTETPILPDPTAEDDTDSTATATETTDDATTTTTDDPPETTADGPLPIDT